MMNTQRKMRSMTMATYFQSSFTCNTNTALLPLPGSLTGSRNILEPGALRGKFSVSYPCQQGRRYTSTEVTSREVACPAEVWAQGPWAAEGPVPLGASVGGRCCGRCVWHCAPRHLPGRMSEPPGVEVSGLPLEDTRAQLPLEETRAQLLRGEHGSGFANGGRGAVEITECTPIVQMEQARP